MGATLIPFPVLVLMPLCQITPAGRCLQMGLDVDPEIEERAQALFDEGMALFKEGLLRPSYDK